MKVAASGHRSALSNTLLYFSRTFYSSLPTSPTEVIEHQCTIVQSKSLIPFLILFSWFMVAKFICQRLKNFVGEQILGLIVGCKKTGASCLDDQISWCFICTKSVHPSSRILACFEHFFPIEKTQSVFTRSLMWCTVFNSKDPLANLLISSSPSHASNKSEKTK